MTAAVFYFSRPGENYVDGRVVSLERGNCEIAAQAIADLIGAPCFALEPRLPYPEKYNQCTDFARKELAGNARPALKQSFNLTDFEVIVLCYPCWWGTFPRVVATFLSQHDFAGKSIVPVCTHEGSSMGRSEAEIAELCPEAMIAPGLPLRGSSCQNGGFKAEVEKFFAGLAPELVKLQQD